MTMHCASEEIYHLTSIKHRDPVIMPYLSVVLVNSPVLLSFFHKEDFTCR